MPQLIFNFTTLISVQYALLFVILEKILSLIAVLRALYKKKLLWVKSNLWSSQDKTIEIYSYIECLLMRIIFIQPSTVHKQ